MVEDNNVICNPKNEQDDAYSTAEIENLIKYIMELDSVNNIKLLLNDYLEEKVTFEDIIQNYEFSRNIEKMTKDQNALRKTLLTLYKAYKVFNYIE